MESGSTYLMVTSASGVFNGSPFRNACDITILDEFASFIVPWKMPNSSMHLIDTALPIQFSPIVHFVCVCVCERIDAVFSLSILYSVNCR